MTAALAVYPVPAGGARQVIGAGSRSNHRAALEACPSTSYSAAIPKGAAMLDERENDQTVLSETRQYVRQLRDFYLLIVTALLICGLTFVVNWLTSPHRWWFFWVVFGFGVAIAFSALRLFVLRDWFGPAWERRQIARRLEGRQ